MELKEKASSLEELANAISSFSLESQKLKISSEQAQDLITLWASSIISRRLEIQQTEAK